MILPSIDTQTRTFHTIDRTGRSLTGNDNWYDFSNGVKFKGGSCEYDSIIEMMKAIDYEMSAYIN